VFPFLLGLFFAIITLLIGFWGLIFPFGMGNKGLDNSLLAIRINLKGGIDITDLVAKEDGGVRAKFVYKNTDKDTASKLKLKDVELIIELFDIFYFNNADRKYSDEHLCFILSEFEKEGSIE